MEDYGFEMYPDHEGLYFGNETDPDVNSKQQNQIVHMNSL